MRTTLALLGCPYSYGLLRVYSRVAKTIAALNQVFQLPCEACCRSAVDHLMIKADRQTEILPDDYAPVNDPRLLANAAHRNPEGMGGERNSPSSPFPKHPHGCDAHRPPVFLPHLGRSFSHPHHHAKGRKQHQPGPLDGFETLPGLCHVLHLGGPDLLMNLAQGLTIGCSDDGGANLFLAHPATLHRVITSH